MSAENTSNDAAKESPGPIGPIDWALADALALGQPRLRPLPANWQPPLTYGPLFVGPLPKLDPAEGVVAWVAGLNAIPPENRKERARYLLSAFTDLAVQEANQAAVDARAVIAAQQLSDDAYWSETALWQRQFKSGDELVRALLEVFGTPTSCARLRHQRPAARLYLEAESVGLECPRRLTALEPFCGPGLTAYRAALQQFGRPPSERSARAYCKSLGKQCSPKKRKPSPLEIVLSAMQREFDRVRERAHASPDPEFSRFFLTMEACLETVEPKEKKPQPERRPKESDLPLYSGATTPVTFAVIERDDERYIAVHMVALPAPCPEVLTRKPPAVRGWRLATEDDGGFAYLRPLPTNTSEANARWGEAHRWAVRACLQLSAPLPEPPCQRT